MRLADALVEYAQSLLLRQRMGRKQADIALFLLKNPIQRGNFVIQAIKQTLLFRQFKQRLAVFSGQLRHASSPAFRINSSTSLS